MFKYLSQFKNCIHKHKIYKDIGRFIYMNRILWCLFFCLILICHNTKADKRNFMGIYNTYKHLSTEQLVNLGRDLMNRNENDSAIAVFTMTIERRENKRDKNYRLLVGEAKNCIGIISYLNGNYSEAYSKFYSLIDGDDDISVAARNNLAGIYYLYNQYDRCYEAIKDNMIIALKQKNFRRGGTAAVNLCNLFQSGHISDKTNEITSYIRQFLFIVDKTNPDKIINCKHDITIAKGFLKSLENRHADAIEYFLEAAIKTKGEYVPDRGICYSFYNIGNEFRLLNKPDSALKYYGMAENIAHKHHFLDLQQTIYKKTSETYREMGDSILEMNYRNKFIFTHDSIYNIGEYNKIRDLQLKHEVSEFKSQLELINTKHSLQKRTLTVASIASVIFIFLIIWLLIINRNLKKKNRIIFNLNLKEINTDTKPPVNPEIRTSTKYSDSPLSVEMKDDLKSKIAEIMSDETLFCKQGFSLNELASLCNSNPKYVSQVINETLGKTFPQLLNEARIKVARSRMLDQDNYGNLTLEAIASSVGISSRTAFSRIFKQLTGLTPSEFIKIAKK